MRSSGARWMPTASPRTLSKMIHFVSYHLLYFLLGYIERRLMGSLKFGMHRRASAATL